MPQERGYIPENQQAQIQPEPEQRRPQERASRGLKRIKQIGPLMAVMLAANLGLVGAARTTDSREPEVQPLVGTDILGGIGSFTNPGADIAQSPDGWNMVIPNPSLPPVYENAVAFSDSAVTVQTDGTAPCESNGWITQQAFSINPNNVYTLQFLAVYKGSESPHGINPKVTLDWKNSQDQSLNTSTVSTFANVPHADSWGNFSRSYGLGQLDTIPQGAAKVGVEIEGDQTDPSCTGKLYYDGLALTITSEPTPPPSVGGIAEMPDLPPAAMVSHSSKDTLVTNVEIAVGSTAVLAAAGIAGAEANRRRKRRG